MATDHSEILQSALPACANFQRLVNKLPGVAPVPLADWLIQDDAYAGQMAYRDHLLATRKSDVFACLPAADQAASALLALVVDHVRTWPGYERLGHGMRRSDGVEIDLHSDHPLLVAGRLVQADLCLIEKAAPQVFQGAVLCFPASWSLSEKLGRSLMGVHDPVPEYDAAIGTRVGRLFQVARDDTVLCRHNRLAYANSDLFQPRAENARRDKARKMRFTRVERQTIRAIPKTNFAVFAIHTCVVAGA